MAPVASPCWPAPRSGASRLNASSRDRSGARLDEVRSGTIPPVFVDEILDQANDAIPAPVFRWTYQ
jgi:hypothetical protein